MQRNNRAPLVFIGLIALAPVLYIGWQVWTVHTGWSGLRHGAAAIETPEGWRRVGQVEEGSAGCFVSCDEPRITVLFQTTEPESKACSTIRAAVDRLASTKDRRNGMGSPCDWEAPFPPGKMSDSDPRVWAGVEKGDTLTSKPGPGWRDGLDGDHPGNLVWVTFSSGLD